MRLLQLKFEEVLPLMREGKKAQTQRCREDGSHWEFYLAKSEIFSHSPARIMIGRVISLLPHLRTSRDDAEGLCWWHVLDETWEIME